MGDVVKMQVFLVHNAAAPMDFKAYGYTQFFGGSCSLTCYKRSRLLAPRRRLTRISVEIEVIAVKAAK